MNQNRRRASLQLAAAILFLIVGIVQFFVVAGVFNHIALSVGYVALAVLYSMIAFRSFKKANS